MSRLLKVLAVLLLVTACDGVGEPSPTVMARSPIVTAQSPWTGPSDWPGPLRVEPAGGAATVRMDDLAPGLSDREPRTFTDARAEIDGPAWLDITTVTVLYVDLEGNDYEGALRRWTRVNRTEVSAQPIGANGKHLFGLKQSGSVGR